MFHDSAPRAGLSAVPQDELSRDNERDHCCRFPVEHEHALHEQSEHPGPVPPPIFDGPASRRGWREHCCPEPDAHWVDQLLDESFAAMLRRPARARRAGSDTPTPPTARKAAR